MKEYSIRGIQILLIVANALLVPTILLAEEPPPDHVRQVVIEAKIIVICERGTRELEFELQGSRWGRSQPAEGEQIDGLPETDAKWVSLLVSQDLTEQFEAFVAGQSPFTQARIRVVSYGNPRPITYELEQALPMKVSRRAEYSLVQVSFESVTMTREEDDE